MSLAPKFRPEQTDKVRVSITRHTDQEVLEHFYFFAFTTPTDKFGLKISEYKLARGYNKQQRDLDIEIPVDEARKLWETLVDEHGEEIIYNS